MTAGYKVYCRNVSTQDFSIQLGDDGQLSIDWSDSENENEAYEVVLMKIGTGEVFKVDVQGVDKDTELATKVLDAIKAFEIKYALDEVGVK